LTYITIPDFERDDIDERLPVTFFLPAESVRFFGDGVLLSPFLSFPLPVKKKRKLKNYRNKKKQNKD